MLCDLDSRAQLQRLELLLTVLAAACLMVGLLRARWDLGDLLRRDGVPIVLAGMVYQRCAAVINRLFGHAIGGTTLFADHYCRLPLVSCRVRGRSSLRLGCRALATSGLGAMRHILARPLILSIEAVSVIAMVMRNVHILCLVKILALIVSRDLIIRVPLNLLV